MTQLELTYGPKWPTKGSQCYDLLIAFGRGERLTVLTAIDRLGIYALSQRCGELREKYRWPIQSRTIVTSTGKKVSEYWMDLPGTKVLQRELEVARPSSSSACGSCVRA